MSTPRYEMVRTVCDFRDAKTTRLVAQQEPHQREAVLLLDGTMITHQTSLNPPPLRTLRRRRVKEKDKRIQTLFDAGNISLEEYLGAIKHQTGFN